MSEKPADSDAHAYAVLDLALRVGEILLSSGAGAGDVSATMHGVTDQLGLRNVDVDVTFASLRISYQPRDGDSPLMRTRTIDHRDIDYDDLTRTHRVVDGLFQGQLTLAEARTEIARISSTGHWLPRWAIVAGSGVVGAGVALILGGGVTVSAAAASASMAIDLLTRAMSRRRWPMFYQQAGGGFLATAIALAVSVIAPELDVSLVITACIVVLLAGIGFMGAIQDALSGYYLTASARILEAMMATAGLLAGISAALAVADRLGISLFGVNPGEVGVAHWPLVLIGSVLCALAFAFTCYVPLRALPEIAAAALAGGVVYVLLLDPTRRSHWTAAVAAVVVGALSYPLARRIRVPPLVVVIPALVPMLPGLMVLRGLSNMSNGETQGIIELTGAAATTIGLAAGAILGEYLAQPVQRHARRLETRLSGPRMAGAMHGQRRRRER